jgi:hypothetical protein
MTIVSFAGNLNRISLILNVHNIILSKSSSLIFLCSFIRVIPEPKIGTETLFEHIYDLPCPRNLLKNLNSQAW